MHLPDVGRSPTSDVARSLDSTSDHIGLQFNVQRQIGRGDVRSEKKCKKTGIKRSVGPVVRLLARGWLRG